MRTDAQGVNAAYPWDRFDPAWYTAHNYARLRHEDRQIVVRVRDFFVAALGSRRVPRAIDVGSGPNLYPALTMLPFSEAVLLYEPGAANRKWLRHQIGTARGYEATWDPFWDLLCRYEPYTGITDPRRALHDRASVRPGDVFRLPRRQWNLGTMFFVAESVTSCRREFRLATQRFIHSLRAGAPFAAAFMRNSSGYTVGSHRFPAVAVDEVEIKRCLSEVARLDTVVSIGGGSMLREEYEGMVLALGWANGGRA